MFGTTLDVLVDRPVDGDTVRVLIDGTSESLRILCIDTEESRAGGDKPLTPWGRAASAYAATLFVAGSPVTLEFPGTEPLDVCLTRYRDNYGRLLVFVHLGDVDYQDEMIGLGYSPYFTKYGNAEFAAYHVRYAAAERRAQAARLGVWDQVAVNGSVQRDYIALSAWWQLRAAIIDGYRRARAAGAAILDARLDFAEIRERAERGETATIFTELRAFRRLGSRKASIDIGSRAQPFQVFLPDIEGADGQAVINLLQQRFIAGGSDGRTIAEPRRSYAYVRGPLKLFRDAPEIEVTTTAQVFDDPPAAAA